MRIVRYFAIGLAIVGAACSRDSQGDLVTPDPVAGLRYVNLVTDTGAMDFRIIDIVGDAPSTSGAAYRTGGQVFGVVNPSPTQPPYQPVRAGARHIRVFMNGTTSAIASTQMFDTTFTFEANNNYTFLLYGTARTGTVGTSADHTGPFPAGNRCCSVVIVKDTIPTIAANKFAVRVLDLTNNFTGAVNAPPAGTNVDVRVASSTAAIPTATTSAAQVGVLANTAFGGISPYVLLDTTGTAAASVPAYKVVVAAAGTSSPVILQAMLPTGTRGTSVNNPFAGTSVGGTAMTMVLVPRSVAGSLAPQSAASAVTTNIDSLTRVGDTVSVWRKINAATATACQSPVAAGAAVNDVLNVTGATQPEYNGAVSVILSSNGTAQNLWSQRIITQTGATGGFTLSFGGQTTSVLPAGATAAQIQAALAALSGVGAANVSVSGPAAGPDTVLFMGTFTNTTVGSLSASANGGLTVTVSTPAVGCGTAALVTRDTVSFTGAVATDSFKITVGAASTPNLVVGATAATVQAAIAALSTVGSSGTPATPNVTVTGTGPYVITFNNGLNNQNVAFSAAMKAGSVGTITVAKAAYVFSGAATASRFRYRIAGTPVSPATGAPQYKIVTNTNDYTLPSAIFLIDKQPPRTAP